MAVIFFPRSRASHAARHSRSSDRRYPSPSAQFRSGEQWRVRLGLGAATLLTLCASAAFWNAVAVPQ
jgi:hypothetical protein